MGDNTGKFVGCVVGVVTVALFGLIGLSMWLGPLYGIWNAEQTGKSELAQQEYTKQVQVAQAQANLAAQKLNAQAEVERAKGVAAANNIIKLSITEDYLRYLWVQSLDKSNHETIIYVPTDGQLPVTEAGRVVRKK